MKKMLTLAITAITLFTCFEASAQSKKSKSTKPNNEVPTVILQNKLDSISYIIGHDIGNNLHTNDITINPEVFNLGVKHGVEQGENLINAETTERLMMEFQQEMMAKRDQKSSLESAAEKAKGEAFLQENKQQPGVVELPSGLQYKVINEGTGENPKPEDVVEVHYTGKLIDGTVFDSSVERGESIKFPLNGVIPGWTEGLQLMKPGAKYTLFIPASLGYGDKATGPIPAGSTLIFDVELISIEQK